MNESILNGILIFGAVQAIFFSLLFFTKKKNAVSDKIIGFWLLILAINIFTIVYANSTDNIYFKVIQITFILLHGPFLFLYARKLTKENAKFHKTDILHFIPFTAIIIIGLLSVVFKSDIQSLIKEISLAGIISGISYCIIVLYSLIKHNKKIKDKFSFFEKINLQWLFRLTIGLSVIWIGGSVSGILLRFFNLNIPILWLFTIIPVFIFYIGFYGIKQKLIYSQTKINIAKQVNVLTKENKQNSDKYKKSGLQKQSMKLINKKLLNAMQTEHLFLNSTLSLSELSDHLKIPAHHITQTLNEYNNQTFYDFVNHYRVKEFKKKIFAPENSSFSLLGIAFDCGFNSKSSFNRIFKQKTGLSPSGFQKNSTT